MEEIRDGFRLLGKTPKELGLRIAQLREHKKWSRRALAEEAGISHQYLGEIERGEAEHVGNHIYTKIAQALGWHSMAYALADDDALESTPLTTPTRPEWLKTDDEPPSARQLLANEARMRALAAQAASEQMGRMLEAAALTPEQTERVRKEVVAPAPAPAIRIPRAYESNVAGMVRPVYRDIPAVAVVGIGEASTPDDAGDLSDADDEEQPTSKCYAKMGLNGKGVRVRGRSMEGLGIRDGSVAWINPDLNCGLNDIVLAEVWDEGSTSRRKVIKKWMERNGLEGLWSHDGAGWEVVPRDHYKIIARVVCVQWDGEV